MSDWKCSPVLSPASESALYPSSAYRRLQEQIARFSRDSSATILLEGESGTGKTLLARQIHQNSPRRGKPFHTVVLSALDDALAGSELFGHVAGAFTDARKARLGQFASAHNGSLFLDEIGKTSLVVQQKLLHIVEYGTFRPVGSDQDVATDVRILAATNTRLSTAVEAGEFLPDLYARLNAFRVIVPPLRDRRADIPMLVEHALARHAHSCGYQKPPRVHRDLMDALCRAPWPFNLRQLDAAVHRILVDADGAEELRVEHCEDEALELPSELLGPRVLTPDVIAAALTHAGSVTGAARLLRVDRTTIYRHQRREAASRQVELAEDNSA